MHLAIMLLLALTPDADAAAALALAQPQSPQPPQALPVRPPEQVQPPKSPWPSYADAVAEAKRTGKPLVMFVGNAPPRLIPGVAIGVQAYYVRTNGEKITDKIMISTDLKTVVWLPASATDADIQRAIATADRSTAFPTPQEQSERQVKPMASPFAAAPIADDDASGPVGPWSKSISFPKGLRSYKRTVHSQSIFNQGTGQRRILRKGDPKWLVPGGMVGVDGWRSDLYRLLPKAPKEWLGPIAVTNGIPPPAGKGWQWEVGYLQEYANGTEFHDVLSYQGKIFEHRIREKVDGAWQSYVAFKDVGARPPGYHGLQWQRCAECHNQAGTGSYSEGLIAGGDTVFSFPIAGVEALSPHESR